MVLSNSVYDKLKPVTQVWLPALGSLYFGLSQIWDYPYGEEVVGSIALLTTFFGVILGVTTKQYEAYKELHTVHAGDIVVNEGEDGKKIFTLDLGVEPEVLMNREQVTFNITHPDNDFWEPRHLAD